MPGKHFPFPRARDTLRAAQHVNGRPLLLWLWIAALAASAAETRRIDVASRVGSGFAGFESLAPDQTGVRFTNFIALQRHLTNNILLDGSGVACGDVDGDGLVDVYFAGLDGANALYRNLGGWKFEDIAVRAGVDCPRLDSTGVVLADIDGDGDLDLIVNSMGGGTHVFFNDGKAHFTPSPQNPLNGHFGGTSLALADIDGNGTLDLYIANYRTVTLRDQPNTKFNVRMTDGQPQVTSINGRPLTDPEYTNRFTFVIGMKNGTATFTPEENGEPDGLYLNDGKGHFTLVPFTAGAFLDENGAPLKQPPFDWGLSVTMRDLNGDGAPDIYVCNDFKSPDRIWLNDGKGHFRAIPSTAIRQTSLFSMGLDVADVNRDGAMDIFVLDMLSREHRRRMMQRGDAGSEMPAALDRDARAQSGRNTLLLARGDGTYAETAQFAGIQASEWSWTPIFLDVDLDGFEDLLIANGFERDGMNVDIAAQIKAEKTSRRMTPIEQLSLRARYPKLATPNVAFRNLGNGRFTDASSAWHFDLSAVSQGMALADLDNDGDMDVVINNLNGPAFILRNTTSSPRIAVRLRGMPPNTRGIGARVMVRGGPVAQSQEIVAGGRYQSSDDAMRVFAAAAGKPATIEVTWRSGKQIIVSNALPNSIYEIGEAEAKSRLSPGAKPQTNPWFQDVSGLISHSHVAESFDDFERQPLLPRALSSSGPGAAWCDVDGDGWDDLLIGGDRANPVAVFRNDSKGGFKRAPGSAPFAASVGQGNLLAFRDAAGALNVLAGTVVSHEVSQPGAAVRRYESNSVADFVAPQPWTLGALAMADVDGDGELDAFVGGRCVPGHYPQPASALIVRQSHGAFTIDPHNSAVLANIGMVNGAVFSDLTGDGRPDLVVACDWGAIRVFTNAGGQLVDATAPLGFAKLSGWWNSVASIDADGDGRMDLIAGNWGENTKYENLRGKPLRLYYGDFDGNGVTEVIESYFDNLPGRYVPARQLDVITRGMPWLQQRFPTWDSFSRASVDDLLGEFAGASRVLETTWLATTLFLNRGDHFDAARLPDEAQLAPCFGIAVADFDGDGHEDLLLAQNFFGVTADASRYDAGRGLLLRGDGKGGFSPIRGEQSGIVAYGEQRAAAVGDFDRDGRPDVAVTQNGGQTKLYRNTSAKPGVRIRLAGPPGNRAAIGAILRVGDEKQWGAAREIRAGGGYFSQDSPVHVMPRTGAKVQTRWPSGKVTTTPIPMAEFTIEPDGAAKVSQ